MQKIKKLIGMSVIVVMAALIIGVLSGCNSIFGPSKPKHEHTFSPEWSYDGGYHWHDSTCGCGNDVTDGWGEHVLSDDFTHDEYWHIYTCIVCGGTVYKNHSFNFTDPEIEYHLICGEQDKYIYTCSVCGDKREEMRDSNTAHSWSEWDINDGVHSRVCTTCGTEQSHDAHLEFKKCTKQVECEVDGEDVYACSGQECTVTETRPVPHTGHSWSAFSECNENEHKRKCYNCLKEEIFEHELTAWTSVSGAKHSRRCTDCSYAITDMHDFKNGSCALCAYKSERSDGLLYSAVRDGGNVVGYTVSGIGTFKGTDLVVPSQYSGLPVIGIEADAFKDRTELTAVTVPDSVITIGEGAFSGCSSIAFMTLPFIGGSRAAAEASDVYPQYPLGYIFGSRRYGGGRYMAPYYYKAQDTLTNTDNFYVPFSLYSITVTGGRLHYGALDDVNTLNIIILGDGVTAIEERSLSFCSSTKYLYIGGGLSSVDENAMRFSTALDRIECSGDNASYYSSDDTLIEKATKAVVLGSNNSILPSGITEIRAGAFRERNIGELVIPDTVTEIGANAFTYSKLTAVTLSAGLTHIGDGAFENCVGLTAVSIPENVKSIGKSAFAYCPALVSVEWNAVSCESAGDSLYPIFGSGAVERLVMGDKVTYIPRSAFYHCTSLKTLDISASVAEIDEMAFYGCSLLRTVTFKNGSTPLVIKNSAFGNCGMEVLALPARTDTICEKAFYSCKNIRSLAIPDGVTTIEGGAFAGCGGITELTLPFVGKSRTADLPQEKLFGYIFGLNYGEKAAEQYYSATQKVDYSVPRSLKKVTVTSGTLPFGAFSGCDAITHITVPSGITGFYGRTFYGCAALISVNIPTGLTQIGEHDFRGCAALTAISLPIGITAIPEGAFEGCVGLETLNTASAVTEIGARAFYGCAALSGFDIPTSVTRINDETFYGCASIPSVALHNGIVSVGDGAFFGLSEITSLTVPSSVVEIGAQAFADCVKLADITINSGVAHIGDGAFKNCAAIELVIPDSVTHIGAGAFNGCASLTSLTLPFVGGDASATEASAATLFGYIFGADAYDGGMWVNQMYAPSKFSPCYIPDSLVSVRVTGGELFYGAFYSCRGIAEVTLDDVDAIENMAFNSCSGLTAVNIPDSVETIGNYAFNGCRSLLSVTIGSGVTSFGNYAFCGCTSLTSVSLPTSLTSMGVGAFSGCVMLAGVTVPTGVSHISEHAFTSCRSLSNVTVEGAVSIGDGAFADCKALLHISLPQTLETIGAEAFKGCVFSAVTLPESLEGIGDGAFADCVLLKTVYWNARDLTAAGSREAPAFAGTSVNSVIFGDSVRNIPDYALYGLNGITALTLPAAGSVTSIGKYAFAGTSVSSMDISDVSSLAEGIFEGCASLSSVALPADLTAVPKNMFKGCVSLTGIMLPDDLAGINDCAFEGCSALSAVNIPADVNTIGAGAFAGCTALVAVDIPGSGAQGLAIGERAFENCIGLTEITLPNRTAGVGSAAFKGCVGLTQMTVAFIGKSRTATNAESQFGYIFGRESYDGSVAANQFYSESGMVTYYLPTSLTSVTVTDAANGLEKGGFGGCEKLTDISVTSAYSDIKIGYRAFNNCYALKNLTLPDGSKITSIGKYAFYCCHSLTSFEIPRNLTSLGVGAFFYCDRLSSVVWNAVSCVTNTSTSTSVESAFYGCNALETVTFGSEVKIIPVRVFENCAKISSVTIPNSVTTIYNSAFSGCSGIKTLTFAGGDRTSGKLTIQSSAFKNCNRITTLDIPSGTEKIDSAAFAGCSALTSIGLPFVGRSADESSTVEASFFGYIFGTSAFADNGGILITQYEVGSTRRRFYFPAQLRSVTVKGGNIHAYAFRNCTMLTSIVLSEGVKKIDNSGFNGCTGLTSFTIPDSVTSALGIYAFSGCTGLTSVVIGDGVTALGESAFYNCSKLKNVTIGSAVTKINTAVFYGCGALTNAVFKANAVWTCKPSSMSASSVQVTVYNDPAAAATYLRDTYCAYTWTRNQ